MVITSGIAVIGADPQRHQNSRTGILYALDAEVRMDDNPRYKLACIIHEITDRLHAQGVQLPDELKRRDRREPKRRDKQDFEDRIELLIRRRWNRQKRKILERIEGVTGRKQNIFIDDILFDDDPDDEEIIAALIALLTKAAKEGINLFDSTVGLSVDFTITNAEAARWARDYTYHLIKGDRNPLTGLRTGGIDAVTRDAVSKAVAAFVETPGMTMKDLADMLPFGEGRAQRIARTEVTRAYAEGQRMAGEKMREDYPDIRVTKTWFTNNDDIVAKCEICYDMDGQEVDFDEPFKGGDGEDYDAPPAHVNCRCWMDTRTRING